MGNDKVTVDVISCLGGVEVTLVISICRDIKSNMHFQVNEEKFIFLLSSDHFFGFIGCVVLDGAQPQHCSVLQSTTVSTFVPLNPLFHISIRAVHQAASVFLLL